ncbi:MULTISPECIES: hypothetical protein [unclassified Nostoc]|uniref:hypothetical protein n=1 Tax=unclassified Nostoc TaxID=2593658 RepID=UPI001D15D869|nr:MULTISPECIES: hypothetical protein [unclassified Nostoc]
MGFWNQSQSVMPWDFRRGKKNTQPTTNRSPQVQQCDPSYPDIYIPPNSAGLNCSDIPYRREESDSTRPARV